MKYAITLLFFLSLIATSFSQTSGTINYSDTRKLKINIEGDMPPPPGLPTEMSNKTVLYYTDKVSLYTNDETAGDEKISEREESGDGNRMIFRMTPPDNKVYCDFEKVKQTKKVDFMQREFLIENDLSAEGWKMTGKQKMILNYPCMEAVKQDSLQKTTIWFTSAIPVSAGPDNYVGLPGLVLEVNENDGERIIAATSVALTVDEKLIVKPKDGKKVTQEEFDTIVAEKMKEMGIDDEGGGPRMMIHIKED